jgi:hypothetical protein
MNKLLLVIVLFLSVSNAADAGSAWVLWERTSNDIIHRDGPWSVKRAFQAHNECTAFLESEIKSSGEFLETIAKGKPNRQVIVNLKERCIILLDKEKTENSIILEYNCLPDTIDPRK